MTIPLHEATVREIVDELASRCVYVVVITGGSPDCERVGREARMLVRGDDGSEQRICDVAISAIEQYADDKGCEVRIGDSNTFESGPPDDSE